MLVRLMKGEVDLDELDTDSLVVLGRTASEGKPLAGRIAAKLNERGWSFARIGETYGVDASTAFRWAQPYLRDVREPKDQP